MTSQESYIFATIHRRASMWHSDRCKRDSMERELTRYGMTNVHEIIDTMIKEGKLKEEDGYVIDPAATFKNWRM